MPFINRGVLAFTVLLFPIRMFRLIIILLISLFILLKSALAADILINEFLIEPEQKIELINSGTETVNISGWYLDDSGGSTFYQISENTLIYPQSCLVFESNFYLNKSSSDTVRLFDNSAVPTSVSAVLVDSYQYALSPELSLSWQRNPDGEDNWTTATETIGLRNSDKNNCIILPSPVLTETPKPTLTEILSPTTIPTATTTPVTEIKNIYLSEIMSNPIDEKEWVEIYNNNDFQVELKGWFIDDIENTGATPKIFNLVIPSKNFASIELSQSIFNNSGDSVRLLNQTKFEIDSVEYSNAQSGISYSRQSFISDAFWCFTEPTFNNKNSSCKEEITKNNSITKTKITNQATKTTTTSKSTLTTSKVTNQSQKTNNVSIKEPKNLIFNLSINKIRKEIPKILGVTDEKNTEKQKIVFFTILFLKFSFGFSITICLITFIYLIRLVYNFINENKVEEALPA